jgi:putative acetyltransferase
MTTRIDPATPADYAAIAEIWWANVQVTHHFLTPECLAYLKTKLPEYLPKFRLYVMRETVAESPIGFIGLNEDLTKLELLFIRPNLIGTGVGKQLLAYALCLGVMKLDCFEANERSLGFYLKHGFVVDSKSELVILGAPYPLLTLTYR